MDSRCDNYRSTNGNLLWPRTEVGDDSHLAIVARDCFADYGLSDSVLAVGSTKSLKQLGAI